MNDLHIQVTYFSPQPPQHVATMSTNTIRLICVPYDADDPRNEGFVVCVDPSVLVTELKELIISQLSGTVEDLKPPRLTLWHVSIHLFDEDFQAKWDEIRLDNQDGSVQRMVALRPLSFYFSDNH